MRTEGTPAGGAEVSRHAWPNRQVDPGTDAKSVPSFFGDIHPKELAMLKWRREATASASS
jgi:hypothetical protein